jgi:hypothetical protein
MTDIWKRRHMLDKARREFMGTAMKEYDRTHYEQMRLLREECAKTTGHTWRFTNVGPIGHIWHHCTLCGTSKVDPP